MCKVRNTANLILVTIRKNRSIMHSSASGCGDGANIVDRSTREDARVAEGSLPHVQRELVEQLAEAQSNMETIIPLNQRLDEIERICNEQIALSKFSEADLLKSDTSGCTKNRKKDDNGNESGNDGGWKCFWSEGEMRMYRREEQLDGLVVDPLKAQHTVHGVTAYEMAIYFFDPFFRFDWEPTLEKMKLVERVSDDLLVFHQIHKRIWPTAQRDSLFWSRLVPLPNENHPSISNWAVVNHSTEHKDYPPNVGSQIRISLAVCLLCQTQIANNKTKETATREDISCKVTYCSVGGWAPVILLREVYKREYPKFLKRYTKYVTSKCAFEKIRF